MDIKKGVEVGKQEGIEFGKQEGIELGKQEGIETGKFEAKLEDCQRMLTMNMSFEQISIITGFSTEQIKQISNK